MAGEGEENNGDFYSILGLEKECSEKEIKAAYKKLAMKWHPDKLLDSASLEQVEEAKENFQDIQEAYSVLSSSKRRFLYDLGVYDSNDHDDNRGMGAFLEEITQMIHDNKHKDNGQETLEDLQRMFLEQFQDEVNTFVSSADRGGDAEVDDSSSSRLKIGRKAAGSNGFCHETSEFANSRSNAEADGGARKASSPSNSKLGHLEAGSSGFCYGLDDSGRSSNGRGQNIKKG